MNKKAVAYVSGFEISQEPDVALLSETCGYAGCDTLYFVSQRMTTKGANPRTIVISAFVSVPALGTIEVVPADLRNLKGE